MDMGFVIGLLFGFLLVQAVFWYFDDSPLEEQLLYIGTIIFALFVLFWE